MTETQLTIHRRLLLEKRVELKSALSANRSLGSHSGGRFADSLDQSAHGLETAVQVRLRQNHNWLLRAVEAALDRIDCRTFGVCEGYGGDIPAARLNAVPWARLCRECKEQQDSEVSPLLL